MAAIICPGHRPQMATVRPGVFSPAAPNEARRGTVGDVALSPDGDGGVKLLEFLPAAAEKSLADAKVIVSVGRGIGSPKNIAKAYALADLIGAQVGVSRPLVDLGWSEYPHQIGQTGCSVAPDLLIACGISGAIQHLAGIGGAKNIIAVNNDPDAPIFSVAQYKVVGDCLEVLDELISQIKKARE
jgi:electron transfer flavoprotein alpha subunit